MTNKMLKVAGRDAEGLAKPLKIDKEGKLEVSLVLGKDVADGSQVNELSFEKDNDGYNAIRVVDAAPWAYDPLTDALNVRHVGRKVLEEEIYPDQLRGSANWFVYKNVPDGAKGLVFQFEAKNVSGTFTTNQGYLPRVEFLVGSNVIMDVRTNLQTSAGIHTIIISPDVDPTMENVTLYNESVRPVKFAKMPIFGRLRFRVQISGEFAEGEGIQSYGKVFWLM